MHIAHCSLSFWSHRLAVPGRGPFHSCCSFNYSSSSSSSSSSPNLIAFRGPKHARKVRKLAHTFRTGENLRLICGLEVGVAKWLDSATYKYSADVPRAPFHVHVRKSVQLCNLKILQKCLQVRNRTQQEVGYFEFSRHILRWAGRGPFHRCLQL